MYDFLSKVVGYMRERQDELGQTQARRTSEQPPQDAPRASTPTYLESHGGDDVVDDGRSLLELLLGLLSGSVGS
jgi:hypothetical protein